MEDLLIRGGQVIDGNGTPARRADVAIKNGRITAVGDCEDREAQREIDASGQIVAPGFIDIHTHSDFTLPLNPLAESKVRQGDTTEVVGNCGYSTAPVLPGKARALQDYLRAGAPWLDYEPRTFAQYLDGFPATSVNTVMQVGHATLRLMTMGLEARDPSASELSHMQQLLAEGLEAGALGMSTGLFTAPGNYARSEELLALAGVLRQHSATYASHIRDEANHVFEAVREAIGIGQSAGVRVQIAHLKLSGTDNWGDVPSLLSMISEAREQGIDLFCDQYPYTAGTNPLRNLLPVWVQEEGVEDHAPATARRRSKRAHAGRDPAERAHQFRASRIMARRPHCHQPRNARVGWADRGPSGRGQRYRPVGRRLRHPLGRQGAYPHRGYLDGGRGRAGNPALAHGPGGLRRKLIGALRYHRPGEAAPPLLRHLRPSPRPLRP